MSGPDDTFLARWSRRKQAVKEAESAQEQAGDQPAPTGEAPPDAKTAVEGEPPAVEDMQSLPKIEELTAESDISAFLRKGVPDALRKAALRKAWSLDPTIRDFVGPAEYAWDFNNPASIPGFGAAPAGSALAKLADLGAPPSGAMERTPAPEPPRETAGLSAATEDVTEARQTPPKIEAARGISDRRRGESAPPAAATQGGDEPPDEPARRRHGSALPR